MKKYHILIALCFTTALQAQAPIVDNDVILTPNFFMAILAGVILALTFQFMLTVISIAGGITAVGDIRKSYVKSKVNSGDNKESEDDTFDQNNSPDVSMGVKITTAFGIWSVVTTCVALFGATALALNLSAIESTAINTTVALVIWALFFLILFYLETKIASTLIGSLISTATSGLKASASTVSSLFTTSPEAKVDNIIGNTVDRIRAEFDSGFNTDKLSEVLDNFLTRVDNKIPDYETLRNDLEGIAKKSQNKNTSAKWMAIQQILTKFIAENNNSTDPEKQGKAKKLQETLNELLEKYKAGDNSEEGIKNVVSEISSMDKEEIDMKTQRLKEYLSTSALDGFSLVKLKQAFKGIVNHPQMTASILSNQLSGLNRENIIKVLASNTNLKENDYEMYADQISDTLKNVSYEFDIENENRLVKRIEGQVENFFNSTGRQELNYGLLKNDVKRIFDNPKDSLDVIKNRFSTFDTDTLRAVATNNKYLKDEHIDGVIKALTDSQKEVLDKIAQIESKANQQIETLKRKAVIQAEHARATAASAAWWLVLTAILSAVAAMGGSMLPL
ncbi:hypothetical protein H4O18_18795 [Arenibacter sp. BSSL-BM3]|uniref:Uncharacterized protein n=1 Tax=Arenibacter arenosicollis TaxID=2762274 RepID=A0ABR7QSX8_9FLAO|nr:hypothetical protein [Arenibacter arenosicollis]MBC8770055.1 hypothetical protein [Arenibacter arenosicollis]